MSADLRRELREVAAVHMSDMSRSVAAVDGTTLPPDRHACGPEPVHGSVRHDSTQWSAYALEWTPQKITAYVNGTEWYSTPKTDAFRPRPMTMTVQLDYFPPAGGATAMHLDWAKQWALPESVAATLSLAPGDPATGQPRDYPDRAPRMLEGAGGARQPAPPP
ncbi:family 16 glycosylhydrolase [Pseudonocardia acidicola]|uniref:Family 16 glycosylhydrolase n=1 Tax=Pseudonocardia acidicola TaxID=2724939 RepID=A0ABX1SK80_9PSEU|nr:family 16 glycosylhydrolase [Pseudonocardia acidicola]NMI01979.1 family 16 glycosylhydrolase [Pseudonocardia acidicola]